MAKSAVKVQFLEINAATLNSPTWVIVPGGPIANPTFMLRVVNNSDKSVLLSFDGVNPFDAVRTQTDMILNFQTNSQPSGWVAQLATGTKLYVLGIAGTGIISFSCYYQAS